MVTYVETSWTFGVGGDFVRWPRGQKERVSEASGCGGAGLSQGAVGSQGDKCQTHSGVVLVSH